LGRAVSVVVEGLESRRLLSVAGTAAAVSPSAVYVNAAWAGSGQGQVVTDGYGSHSFGVDAFATIQGGVNAVASSGTVYADAGTYNESVTINKPLALIGNQHDVPGTAPSRQGATSSESIINGGSSTSVNITSSGVSMNGVDITGIAGISNTGGSILIQDNIVNTSGQGITLVASGNITISNNAVTSAGGNAIQIQGSPASPDVSVQNNSIGGTGGIILLASTGDLTLGNVIASGNSITAGNGGDINLSATGGGISTGSIDLSGNTLGAIGSAGGSGGMIILTAGGGSIMLGGATAGASINNNQISNTGSGGSISLTASGSVSLGIGSSISGNNINATGTVSGGMISLSSTGGSISMGDGSVFNGNTITSANGGGITLTATGGSIGSSITLGAVTAQGNSINVAGIGLSFSANMINAGNLTIGGATASQANTINGNGGSITLLSGSGSISLGNVVLDTNSMSGDIGISGATAQMTSLDFSGNLLGGNVNLSATGTAGDVMIGDPAALQNQAITISGNRTETVGQNQSITISANRDVAVSGNVTISGNRTETVSQNGSITVSANRDLTVNGNTTVNVNHNQSITIGANRTETVSHDKTITISGNRTETVGNNATITIGGGTGNLSLGNLSVSGNILNAVSGGGALSLSAGGSLSANSFQVSGNTIGGTAGHDAIDVFAGTLGASGGSITIQSNSVTGGAGATGINLVAGGAGGTGGSINLLSNTIGGSAAADGINVSGANGGSISILSNTIGGSAAADAITLSKCGTNPPNVISVSSNNITLSGSSGNGGAILLTSCTGSISVSGNTVLGAANDSGISLFSDGSVATSPIGISNNNLTGGNGLSGTGVGINLDQSFGGLVYADMASNTVGGFGTGVQVLSTGAADLVNATIGGTASSDSNTIQSCATAILVSGSGATATVSHNSDPIYMEYEGLKGESQGNVHSDHNKWIEVNSFQFGVGRGITSSSGATVTSDHDSITLLPGVPDNVGIYVNGGSFTGSNDLIDGGAIAGTPSNAVGMYVSPSNPPTEKLSINFTKIQYVNTAIIDDDTTPGVAVDASGNYWGTNSESGIANTIGGAAAAEVDYTPWLDNGTNLVPPGPGGKVNPGFEGDFSTLDVGLGGAQVQTVGRISEAIGLLTPGGAIQVGPGAYNDSPMINKNMTLRSIAGSGSTVINGAVTIQGGVTLQVQFPAPASLQISALTIASMGTLDLTNSTLFINYGSAVDPVGNIRGELSAGYNNGTWAGTPTPSAGVITSTAARTHNGYMIGYADSADGVISGLPANTIELKYTLGGDLNLSGTVVFSNFALVVANYGKPAAWDTGAITYGTTVSFADFALTVANYGKQAVTSAILSASLINNDATGNGPNSGSSSAGKLVPAIQPVGSTDQPPPTHRSAKQRHPRT
jgi:hypothetical protein